jgi:hypothetical protein
MVMPPRTHEPPEPAREAGLDETVEDSFPASDPPSTIPDPDSQGRDTSDDQRLPRRPPPPPRAG